MPRILIATDCFYPRWDGITRFLLSILPHLPYSISIAAPEDSTTPNPEWSIHTFSSLPVQVGDFKPSKVTAAQMSAVLDDVDLVWSHTIGPIGQAAIKAAKVKNIPVISTVHSLEWELVPRSLSKKNPLRPFSDSAALHAAKKCYQSSQLVMVPSQEIAELLAYKGISCATKIVSLGVNTDQFIAASDKVASKRALQLRDDLPVIGYVGRLSREKSLSTLIDAYRFVRPDTRAQLLVVGDGIPSVKKELLKVGAKCVGNQDDVVPYLHAMDVFVMPSLTETTCLATLEAMSCSLPVVVTPVGLMKSYVVDKENGLHFPVKNDYVLSLKLRWLLKDKQLREQIGQRARKTVLENYSWKQTIQQLQDTISSFFPS